MIRHQAFSLSTLVILVSIVSILTPTRIASAQYLDCCFCSSSPSAECGHCCLCYAPGPGNDSGTSSCMIGEPPGPCGGDPSTSNKSYSDPVHMGSGEFRDSVTDLVVPSRGFSIDLRRSYRSQGSVERVVTQMGRYAAGMSPMGYGWDHNHNIFMVRSAPATWIDDDEINTASYAGKPVTVWMGNGTPTWFKWNSTSQQYESETLGAVLVFFASATYVETPVLTMSDGTVYEFNPYLRNPSDGNLLDSPVFGRLHRIAKPGGSWLEYAYDSSGKLQTVLDETGRGLSFTYTQNTATAYTVQVVQSVESVGDGRTVEYEYTFSANSSDLGKTSALTDVHLPGGTVSTPVAQSIGYGYATPGNGNGWAWQLNSITDARGNVVLTNDYVYDTLLQRWVVNHQTYGGDEYNYSWTRVAPGATPADNRIKATTVNRSGQKKELIYDAKVDNAGKITGSWAVVSIREYTGPVTNRSTGAQGSKIRGGAGTGSSDPEWVTADPDYFETLNTYDSLHRLIVSKRPDGSGEKYVYESNTDPLRRNNVTARWRMADVSLSSPASNDIVESWTYGSFGGSPGCGCSSIQPETYTDGRGNVTTYGYDSYGNQTQRSLPTATTGVYGGGNQTAVETSIYGPRATSGDTSGATPQQMSSATRPSNGSGAQTTHYNYYTSGSMVGYLKSTVVSPSGSALTTTYEYDAAGNVTRIIDPRGNDRLYTYDLANNLIVELSEMASAAGANNRYDTKHFYDANNNRVRTDVEQMAGFTTHWITTITDYDVLNRPVRVVKEASSYTLSIPDSVLTTSALLGVSGFDPAAFSVTEYTYDDNGNLTSVVAGVLGTTGGTPNALSVTPVTSTVRSYDERNLLFRETIGLGSEAVTTQFNYDINGNMISRIEGWGLGSNARRTDWVYDAYDRVIEVRDASSTDVTKRTRRVLGYDKAGNLTSDETYGLPDVTTGTGSAIRLLLTTHTYDERNRRILSSAGLLNITTGALIESTNHRAFYYPDGSLQAARDPRSTAAATATDSTSDTVYAYDNAGRLLTTLDPKGNLVTNGYDANGNPTTATSTEKSDVPAEPDQVFTVTNVFDTLNRMGSSTDGVGNVTTYSYDARDNRLTETDERNAVTTWTYDGLDRETSMSMPVGGSGTTIVTQKVWDAASRLIAQIDGNGNRTSYAYDSRSRLIGTRNHDGTFDQVGSGMTWGSGTTPPSLGSFTTGYNAFGDTLRTTDARGNVVDSTFDKMGRLVSRTVSTVGSGVSSDTTWELFRYDGRGRMLVARDNDSFNRFDYDSLGRLLSERSHFFTSASATPVTTDPAATSSEARVVDYVAYDKAGNLTQLLYPAGTWDTVASATYPLRRHLAYTYDTLGRTSSIVEMSNQFASPLPVLTTFGYQGPSRERFRAHANGTRTDRTYSGYNTVSPNPPSNPTGSYGFARTLQVAHTKTGSPAVNLATFDYKWDQTQNRTSTAFSAAKTSGTYSDATAYGYDNAERLTSSARTGGNWAKTTSYTLDPVHNRVKTNEGAADLTYWMNPASNTSAEPQDAQVNQYTRTPNDQNTYDLSGNLNQITLDCKCDIASSAGAGFTDSVINTYDLTAFMNRFGTTDPLADFNGDGAVNSADMTYLLGRFGRACDYETATWDYQNRLVSYVGTTTATSTNKTHIYKYDALGRRIAKTTDVGAEYERSERFVWGGQSAWQMLVGEATESSVTAVTTFVYLPSSGYIDDVVAMRRDVDGSSIPAQGGNPATGTTAAVAYFYHADDMFTVAALTDVTGAVAERYHYDDYGSVRILDGEFNLRTAGANGRIESAIDNPHGFTGREWDAESGLWQYRYRYMSPGMGRFVSRDPIGTWGDELNDGGGGTYTAANPVDASDPFGEDHKKKKQSTGGKSNTPKHQKGTSRKQRDQGGEKGDSRRRDYSNKGNRPPPSPPPPPTSPRGPQVIPKGKNKGIPGGVFPGGGGGGRGPVCSVRGCSKLPIKKLPKVGGGAVGALGCQAQAVSDYQDCLDGCEQDLLKDMRTLPQFKCRRDRDKFEDAANDSYFYCAAGCAAQYAADGLRCMLPF